MTDEGRTLSDADVKAIADVLEKQLADRIVRGAGNGALAFVKKLAVWAIVGLAAYALAHGWKP